jgi:hypothetical protein
MPKKFMTQCLLYNEDGVGVLMTWVPQDLAKKNKRVKIDDKGVNGIYKVKEIYTTMEEKMVIENSQDYRRTRKFSDI